MDINFLGPVTAKGVKNCRTHTVSEVRMSMDLFFICFHASNHPPETKDRGQETLNHALG